MYFFEQVLRFRLLEDQLFRIFILLEVGTRFIAPVGLINIKFLGS